MIVERFLTLEETMRSLYLKLNSSIYSIYILCGVTVLWGIIYI